MTKGTPSKGKRNQRGSHVRCRRCGRHAYHPNKRQCASCGFPRAKLRNYAWAKLH
ncbi:MAG: 50S ribosomal protein L37e [Methanobacteriota archaeon]